MQYCDPFFLLIFLPIVMVLYQILGKKIRPYVLIIASFLFFYSLSGKLVFYIILSIFSIHHFGLWLKNNKYSEEQALSNAHKDEKKDIKVKYLRSRKRILLFGILIQLFFLMSLKYLPFFCQSINDLLKLLNFSFRFNEIKVLAPIGISFYTLMAISYLVDVYHGKIEAESNLIKLALYLSFFPNIMEGPICRYEQIADSLYSGNKIKYQNMCFGLQRILYGLIKKIVIADRLNVIVNNIFLKYNSLDGGILLLGVVLYTIQLYMDFSGVMDVVIGTGEIFGVNIPENFRQPFFSRNISEFWTRWHITLGTWFKDYIFYPVSLSKMSKKITKFLKPKLGTHYGPLVAGSIALFAVWFCNGLWHGAGYNYIFFGLYHFFFILLGNIFAPFFLKLYSITHINKDNIIIHIFASIRTTIIVFFGELFFRAPSLTVGIEMFKSIFSKFTLESFTNKTYLKLGLDLKDFKIIIITLIIVFIVSLLKENNISIREKIGKLPIFVRWPLYYLMIFYLLTFGAYGIGYIPVDPMYASF